jgi:hypothetical protein
MPSTRHGSVLKGAGKEAEKGIKKKKSKAEPAGNASPMRKKAVAQLLRAEKETVTLSCLFVVDANASKWP